MLCLSVAVLYPTLYEPGDSDAVVSPARPEIERVKRLMHLVPPMATLANAR